jgi:DNA-binding NarL/FixJ family response regulator
VVPRKTPRALQQVTVLISMHQVVAVLPYIQTLRLLSHLSPPAVVVVLAHKVTAALVVATMSRQQRVVMVQREAEADSMVVAVQQQLQLVLAVQLRAPQFLALLMAGQVPQD